MRWNGAGWQPVALSMDTSGMYMTAMRDIVAGRGDSAAERAFIGDLMATRAFIDNLLARVVQIHGNGQIVTRNPDGSEWEGLDDPNLGFRLSAMDGQIDANNMRTRGMVARDAHISGGFVAGNTWGENGELINPSSWIGLRAINDRPIPSNNRVEINSLVAYGPVNLGAALPSQPSNRGAISFSAPRGITTNSHLETWRMAGNSLTRAAFYNLLHARFSLAAQQDTVPIALIGSVSIGALVISITEIIAAPAATREYHLFGMANNGVRSIVMVPPSGNNMSRANMTGEWPWQWSGQVNFTQITVNLTQV